MTSYVAIALLFALNATAQDAPVKLSSGVTVGQNMREEMPQYPAAARQSRVSGSVILDVIICEDGMPSDRSVVSGPAMSHRACVDEVKQWGYKPYMLNGRLVAVETTMPLIIDFGG